MEHYKVVRPKHQATKMPLAFTALVYLLMDKWHAAEWVQGVAWTFVGLVWAIYFLAIVIEDYEEPVWKDGHK